MPHTLKPDACRIKYIRIYYRIHLGLEQQMSSAQKKAVERHRKRQLESGITRMEINVPESDRALLRQAAENLRAGGVLAEQTRAALAAVVNPFAGMGLKELIENAPPLDVLDLERSREIAADIEL